MASQQLTGLEPDNIRTTRDALHAYAKGLGEWLKVARARRMNFGFVFGDDSIAEPYRYVSAYLSR